MGLDDDTDCPKHEWRIVSVALGGGSHVEYECIHCGATLMRGPGELFPD